jgi:hypothetical protein
MAGDTVSSRPFCGHPTIASVDEHSTFIHEPSRPAPKHAAIPWDVAPSMPGSIQGEKVVQGANMTVKIRLVHWVSASGLAKASGLDFRVIVMHI